MPFVYRQVSPIMTHDGVIMRASTLYSGHGSGLNNPALEAMANVGPIPAGLWRIIEWLDHYEDKGPIVARLEPVGHDAHKRSGFLIHGDNSLSNHSASHGCIIADHDLRTAMRAIPDFALQVVALSAPVTEHA